MNTRISTIRNDKFNSEINSLNEEIDELEIIRDAIRDYNLLSYQLKNSINKKSKDILYYEYLEKKVWDLLSNLAKKYNAHIDSLDDIHKLEFDLGKIKSRLEIGADDQVTHVKFNNEKIPLYSNRNNYKLFINGLRPMKVLIVDDKLKKTKIAYPILGINMETPEFIQNRLKMSNLEKKVYDENNLEKDDISNKKSINLTKTNKGINNILRSSFLKSSLIDLKKKKVEPKVEEIETVKELDINLILSKINNNPIKVGPRQKILSALEIYLDNLFGENQYPSYLAKEILDDYIVHNKSGQKWLYNLILNNNYSLEIRNLLIKYNIRSSLDIRNIFITKNGSINTQIFWFKLHSLTSGTILDNISDSITKIIKREFLV